MTAPDGSPAGLSSFNSLIRFFVLRLPRQHRVVQYPWRNGSEHAMPARRLGAQPLMQAERLRRPRQRQAARLRALEAAAAGASEPAPPAHANPEPPPPIPCRSDARLCASRSNTTRHGAPMSVTTDPATHPHISRSIPPACGLHAETDLTVPEQRYNALASYETAIAALRCRHLGRLTLRQLAREWQLTLLALRIAALQWRMRLYITALAAAISVIMLAPAPAKSVDFAAYGIGTASCAAATQNDAWWNRAIE